MLRLQGTGRTQKIVGRKSNGSVEKVKRLLCARKHVINNDWVKIRKAKWLFAFVSSPHIYRQKEMLKRVSAWCHVFRHPERILPKGVPSILLTESDFIDSSLIESSHSKSYKYDFCYFTLNASPGYENKGLYTFIEILPILCKMKLKGKVVVYFPNSGDIKRFTVPLSMIQSRILAEHSTYITFHWGLLDDNDMDKCMSECRFGLFPNTVDNSPRILSECLSRDLPVLVNDKIDGGWHYVNNQTGTFFNAVDIETKLKFMLKHKFDAKKYYETNFGFEKSAERLAEFLNPIFGYKYTHMCFKAFETRLKQI